MFVDKEMSRQYGYRLDMSKFEEGWPQNLALIRLDDKRLTSKANRRIVGGLGSLVP